KRFSEWIDKMAVSSALKENLYGNDNFLRWDNSQKLNPQAKLELNADVDKRLFLSDKDKRSLDKSIVDARINAIKQDDACRESMEFFKFKQFIAYDQATKMHQFLNKNGMKEIADVPIGTSLLDVHVFPDAFDIDLNTKNTRGYSTLLCPMDPGIDDWGLPALKNNDAARDYVALKYGNALQSSDTARIDGAWQLRHSFVGHHFDDKNFVLNAPEKPGTTEWRPMDGFFDKIYDVFKKEGKESGIANIVAENQGSGDRITLTDRELQRLGMPTIEINKSNCTTSNILSMGIHDHSSLASNIEKREDQIDVLARLYKGLFNDGKSGTNQIQITAFDLMGRKEQINNSQLSKRNNEKPANTPEQRAAKKKAAKESPNWKARNPMSAESLMYRNLAGDNEAGQKAGSNTYKALNRAFYQKYLVVDGAEKGQIVEHSGIKDAPFVAKVLQYFENVVERKGPYTTVEANLQQNTFMREFKNAFGEKTAKILVDGFEELGNKNIENQTQKFQQMMLKASEAFDEHIKVLKEGSKKISLKKQPIRQVGAKQVAAVATGSFVLAGALAQLFSMKNPSSKTAQKTSRIAKAEKGVIRTLGNNVPSNITGVSNKKAMKAFEKA
ncbi:MAG: 4-alpha-glucanotransferase, partial [Candidatus Gastranaerophilales bacterium]|nr:4-alpha-glucanotransferase [Candidatus Gastranaerophilales bacterium]